MKIAFLGDSITEGALASKEENTFVYKVGQYLNCTALNYGISATRIADQQNPTDSREDKFFGSRVKDMDHSADLVFVFGGTNDFGHGDAPIGNKNDTSPKTFYGACDYLIKELLKYYKKEQVVFVLPLHRNDEDNVLGDGSKKVASLTLEGYTNIIVEVVNRYDIRILDIRNELTKDLLQDGLHPGDVGHEKIARLLVDYIISLNK